MTEEQQTPAQRKKKKQFKPAGAALVQGLLSGADDVATRSFIGGGQGSTQSSAPSSASVPAAEDVPSATAEPTGLRLPPQAKDSSPAPEAEDSASPPKEEPPALRPTRQRARTRASSQNSKVPSRSASLAPAEPMTVEPAASSASDEAQKESPKTVHKPAREEANAASAQPAQEERGTDWAHAAVHESFADAKMRSNQWKSYGFRIAPDVLARLKERLNADRMSSGNRQLALGHYLDAALRHVSGDVPQWIDQATDFATERLWDSESTQPSSYRVGSVAHAWVSGLSNALQSADFGRKGTLVISAQVELYLDALESEGPLVRPERRRH